ncbi:MAG: Methionine aminopeptidase [candidate division WS6 bacterium GW2011_GWE1_34_7]|uniref:Methionine aminopeptidase n=1 Tax=candidate division WS6 bacterium GW2011_GWE1_34_7 TaxID=1619093 RepID=A0A0G0EEK7_9BACT|nr:MAG: Methionine aminopeptidase [candidate division WS6 bacterium GW2011_GWE1_34_7]
MILNKAKDEKILREASKISLTILRKLGKEIKEGITPLEIDQRAGILCKEYDVQPAFKRVRGYDFNTCISVNDVAVHGIPNDITFKKGDLISIDFGIIHKGLYTDHCWTWSLGQPNKKNKKLIQAGRDAVENCIPLAIAGDYTGDLGYEMERVAKENGFNVIKMFIGHGIGKTLHDVPDIPAYGKKGKGDLLVDGMVICIECQVVDGKGQIYIDDDGWSVRTTDKGMSVMFEYMIIVRKEKPVVLTDTLSWDTVIL